MTRPAPTPDAAPQEPLSGDFVPEVYVFPVHFFAAGDDRREVRLLDPQADRNLPLVVEPDGTLSHQFFRDAPTYLVNPRHLGSATYATAGALSARSAAIFGNDLVIDAFTTRFIGRRGLRWREAVSTALLGDWAAPLDRVGSLGPEAFARLKAEAEQIHRQLLPLWRRRTRGSRLLLLDTPFGDGLSLYDLLAGCPDPQPSALDSTPDDARLAAVLHALRPQEREVVFARAQPGVATWAEAAWLAGATDPTAVGERVRRKVRRLAAEQQRRRARLHSHPAVSDDRR